MSLFQIKVTSGSCAGDIIPVSSGETVPIGRSRHSGNRIIFAEMDVSSKHCIVRASDDGTVELEVISDKKTTLDGQMLHSGDRVSLRCGQKVEIGGTASFVIEPGDDGNMPTSMASGSSARESDMATSMAQSVPAHGDEGNMPTSMMPSPSRNAAPGTNAAPAPVGAPAPKQDDNRTKAKENYETIYVSTEELNSKKKKYQSRRLLKSISLGAAVLLFFAVSGALYFWLRKDMESQVAWPEDLNHPDAENLLAYYSRTGDDDSGSAWHRYSFMSEEEIDRRKKQERVALYFPSTLRIELSGDKANIYTAIGTKRDIPLHIQAYVWDDPSGLTIDRMEAFRQCREMLGELKFEQVSPEPEFVNTEVVEGSAGIPLNYASYSRTVGDDEYFGYLVFFRYQIQNFYCMMELPKATEAKTRNWLKDTLSDMFIISDVIVPAYWEGSSQYRKDKSIEDDLKDANLALKGNETEWPTAARCIQGALIKSFQNHDDRNLENATGLLLSLRKEQEKWYHTKKLSYDKAKANDEKQAIKDIPGEVNGMFNHEQFKYSDYRYDIVKEWK